MIKEVSATALEVIATNVADAVQAQEHGADRIELIADMSVGGLTPAVSTVQDVVHAVDIPVNVMVRPHNQSFVYTEADVHAMLDSVAQLNVIQPNGMVLGVLTPAGRIDEPLLKKLLGAVDNHIEVTYHKAFDEIKDQHTALEVLARFPRITKVLTSGGAVQAPEAAEHIQSLVQHAKQSGLSILAGGGLTPDSLARFMKATGVSDVHFGTAVRVNGSAAEPIDGERMRKIKHIITSI